MRKTFILATFLFVMMFLFSACGDEQPAVPVAVYTAPAPIPLHISTLAPQTVPERVSHVVMVDPELTADYLYRSFIQIPVGVTRGPDQQLYIADWTGHHVVRMAKDYTYAELHFWQNIAQLQEDGPRHVAFDSLGNLFVSNHAHIYRIAPDGSVIDLPDIIGGPVGAMIIGPDDVLYYTDRSEQGGLYRWSLEGGSELIGGNLPRAENLAFASDGGMYLSQLEIPGILKIDLESGTASPFVEGICTFDPCFLAVDGEGDLWVRGIFSLRQFSPDGMVKPYELDGVTYPGGPDNWHSSGGIAFDDEGSLWVTSYNSRIYRMLPVNPGTPDPEFTLQLAYPGLEASDLEVGLDGALYGTNGNTHRLLRFLPDGEVEEVYFNNGVGRSAVVVDANGAIYVSLDSGEIVLVNPDGTASHYANVNTRRMVIGGDGGLYAIAGGQSEPKSLVRISGVDKVTVLTDQIDGMALGNGEVHLAPALADGLYVVVENLRLLFRVDLLGQGALLADLSELGGGGPVVMAASPVTGDVFYIPHGPYQLYRITPDGQSEMLAYGISGDPWGMEVSTDGEWLYVAESGVIDRLPIP